MQNATEALLKFRDERDWKQFHDPKNLAAALGIEAAELNEVFLWNKNCEFHCRCNAVETRHDVWF